MGLNHSVEQRADRGMCRAGMHGQRPQLPSRRGDEPQRPCHETHVTGPHARGRASASPCRDQDCQTTECRRHHRRPAERAQPAADPRIAERCRDQRRHMPRDHGLVEPITGRPMLGSVRRLAGSVAIAGSKRSARAARARVAAATSSVVAESAARECADPVRLSTSSALRRRCPPASRPQIVRPPRDVGR